MLIGKIREKKARVGIIGLGYVGLPLVMEFARNGFPVTGLDIDANKVEKIKKGESYIRHISTEKIGALAKNSDFEVTTDFSTVSDLDVILICVPTPLGQNREPDMSYIISTARQIAPHIKKDQLIVLESTTYPGTTQEVLIPELESGSGLNANSDFFVAYSPEREDPNNKEYTTATIPKVIGADHPTGRELSEALYSSIIKTIVPVSETRVAEATKLMENVFRAINIALVNELKMVFDKMGIDIWEVIQASSTKPFGYMPFYPGPGLGGHCIPIDPFYLTWKAKKHGISSRFIELAGEVNISMPDYVIEKIKSALENAGKNLNESRILILGLAYKKNIDDDRESVSFKIMDTLTRSGAKVEYNDPYIPVVGPKREYPQFVGKKSVSLQELERYDLSVILTDHSNYNYEAIVEQSRLVVDTRNACAGIHSTKIIKA
ncbi:MAG: nucleotide sugar dehydrogenase [Nitrospinota bacterium]|nr:nucleotide sugar dehydrogenase [Nitrospinota bacterium]